MKGIINTSPRFNTEFAIYNVSLNVLGSGYFV